MLLMQRKIIVRWTEEAKTQRTLNANEQDLPVDPDAYYESYSIYKRYKQERQAQR